MFVCLGKVGKATSLWLIDFAIYSGFLFGVHVLANRILHVMNSILSLKLLFVKCENVAVEHFISHLLNFVFYNMCTMYMEVFGKFKPCLFRFHIPLFSEMFWNFRGFFFSVLFNWGNKVFNCIQVIIMYNIYPERHLPDFKLILQGGGVEVTFCIVNDFVTWKEVKISYVKSNGNYLLNCRFLCIETKMSTCQYMCIINV